jgi:hypothetical protein
LRAARVTDAAALIGARRRAERAAAALAALDGEDEAAAGDDDDDEGVALLRDEHGESDGTHAPLLCITVQLARAPHVVALAPPHLAVQYACSGGVDGDATTFDALCQAAPPLDAKTKDELLRLLRSADALTPLSDEERALLWRNRAHVLSLARATAVGGDAGSGGGGGTSGATGGANSAEEVARKLLLGGASHSLAALKHAAKKSSTATLFDVRDRSGQCVLHVAARANRVESLQWLLAHKRCPAGFVDTIDHAGGTPLLAAIDAGASACVVALLTAGANVALADAHRSTPLHVAARSDGNAASLAALLAAGAAIDARDTVGDSPLAEACRRGALECARRLLRRGAQVNARSDAGLAPLHYAAHVGVAPLVDALIAAGAKYPIYDCCCCCCCC